jgi:transposase InsO family protein
LRFRFIKAERAFYPVAILCRVMRVSRSGFYAWMKRPESKRTKEDRKLAVLVKAAHEVGRCYYGSPRVHDELKEQGIRIGRKRVIRLMQEQGLVARRKKRKWRAAVAMESRPAAPNLLARDFSAPGPNQRWVGDATELVVGAAAKLYLAVVMDLYSKFIVGWAISASNDRHLAIKALENAIKRRCPGEGLLYHSDQGGPYTSEDYQRALEERGITCSMSRKGNCYDNAAMESWFSTLKQELGEHFESFGSAKAELFDYIEVFYNQKRRHSSLDSLSPAQYERRFRAKAAAAA